MLYEILSAFAPYLVVALLIVTVVLLIWLALLQARLNSVTKHYRRMPSGRGNLDDVYENQLDEFRRAELRIEDLLQVIKTVEAKSKRALQHVGVLRYNPFEDTGGDQSFCVALLDGDENGVVISSIYSRSQCRVYAKPIEKGHSRYQLSTEEEEAIALAKQGQVRSVVR